VSDSTQILAAGPGWLALNKPSGLSVHNDPGADALSVALNLLENDPALRTLCAWKPSTETLPSPAHRLDRETSGVLLLSLNRERASELGQFMEQRKARKIYRAILRGQLREQKGIWQMPLSDRAEGRKNPAGIKGAQKACETQFTKLRENKFISEVEVELITGRQHQIRRHAVLARHAVVGDERYSDAKFNRRMRELFGVHRLLLHAQKLEFTIDGKDISIEAPLPSEFATLFEAREL
jgi:RluA family pseudouridine synthase